MATHTKLFIGLVWLIMGLAIVIIDSSSMINRAFFMVGIFYNLPLLHKLNQLKQNSDQFDN